MEIRNAFLRNCPPENRVRKERGEGRGREEESERVGAFGNFSFFLLPSSFFLLPS
jgi:hypothetical protein